MATAEAAPKVSYLRITQQTESSDIPSQITRALGGGNGCEYGPMCLIRPVNWPNFRSWILKSVANLIPDKLNANMGERWKILRQSPDPNNIAALAEDCSRCCGYVDQVIDTVKMRTSTSR